MIQTSNSVIDRNGFIFETTERIVQFLTEKNNKLSPSAASNLEKIVAHVYDQAHGRLEPYASISCLDPGFGKSTAVYFSVSELIKRGYKRGVLLLYNQKVEGEGAFHTLTNPLNETCVGAGKVMIQTGEERINSLNQLTDANEAQVLIICHNKLCRELEKKNFNNSLLMKYRGEPRMVKCWDEKFTGVLSYSLDTEKGFGSLIGNLNAWEHQERLNKVRYQLQKIAKRNVNTAYDFPHLGLTSMDFTESFQDSDILDTFLALQGNKVSVRQECKFVDGEMRYNEVCLSYTVRLPKECDLYPLLILDASYTVNQISYQEMQRSGRLPVRAKPEQLLTTEKFRRSYEYVDITWWETSAGQRIETNQAHREAVIDGMAAEIAKIPAEEKVLIIGRKRAKRFILPGLWTRLKRDNIHYLHYGKHRATNAYSTVKYVFLVGLFNLPGHAYEALGRGLSCTPHDEDYPRDKIAAVREGSLMDSMMQAALRGNARNTLGANASPMNLYIISTGPIDHYCKKVFPGSRYPRQWPGVSHNNKLGEETDAIIKHIEDHFTWTPHDPLPLATIAEALSVTDPYKMNNIKKGLAFKRVMKRMNLEMNNWYVCPSTGKKKAGSYLSTRDGRQHEG